MTRYLIIGAGAVGATVAAELHDAGHEVLLVARGRHLELLREHGLTYVRPEGTRQVRVPVAGGPDEVTLRRGDVLVLATKSQDTEAALQQWAWQPVAGGSSAAEDLPVLLLQNGLENARLAARRFATVLDAVVLVPSTYLSAGEVVASAAPRVGALYVGVATGDARDGLDGIADDLRDARFLVQVVPDIARWKAGKLVANVTYNLDALAAPGPERDAVTRALRAEAGTVLAAVGLETADTARDGALDLSLVLAHPIAGHERAGSSTWQSLARTGSSLEADYLNGEIVLLARLAGLDAPVNRAVQARLARAAREGTPPGSLSGAEVARLVPADVRARADVLIDVAGLRAELAGPHPPLLLDVRWSLGDPDGRRHHRAGHLPSAVYVDLDTELAATPQPLAGRHPLPSPAALQDAARGWGLREGQGVVVYDDAGGLAAARAWWLLRWAGVADVRILDGALSAWRAAGLPLETGEVAPSRGDVVVRPGGLPVLTADEAAELAHRDDGVLLDARAAERYRGEVEPVDPRAGHIPGAVSAPTGDNLAADGTFRTGQELAARFTVAGAHPGRPVGVYCGSGVTAAHQIAALAVVSGVPAALYPGSWSAWSSDPARPVALGPHPADQLAQEAVSP